MTSGSTLANLTVLWAARECARIKGVVASEVAHLSIPKAAHILGLGYRAIPSVSEHKRLFEPKESALVMFRNLARENAAISLGEAFYSKHKTIQNIKLSKVLPVEIDC